MTGPRRPPSLPEGHSARPAHAGDVDALLALRHAAYGDDPMRPPGVALPDTRESVAREVATGRVLVALDADGRIVASVHARPVVQLRRLAVAPDAKRAGLGGALLDAALRQAAQERADNVELEAADGHAWMAGFYERRGFHARGVLTRPDGTRWLVMRRAL